MTDKEMHWVDVEDPPRRPGDTLAGLIRLMQLVGDEPFRLRARSMYDGILDRRITVYEAWPA